MGLFRVKTWVLCLLSLMSVVHSQGFDFAKRGQELTFPKDHHEHPTFKTEWWYFTGNVVDTSGKQFGYQLTFFRNALSKDLKVKDPSLWSANQIVMAHFAVTDVAANRHESHEKLRRLLPNVTGFKKNPWSLEIANWQVTNPSEGVYHLQASQSGTKISFHCESEKKRVLQGERGYSQKGKDEKNASYYISFTRLKTSGEIQVQGKSYQVSGHSWMDHEFSTSSLDEGVAGWDWFALHLNSGDEVMLYQLREKNGGKSVFSSGTFVNSKGESQALSHSDFILDPVSYWESPNKVRYPISWHIQIPSLKLDLRALAKVKDQEMKTFVPYWEGAVSVTGTHPGQGYLELTGYDKNQSMKFLK